jgi:hypothetical protein
MRWLILGFVALMLFGPAQAGDRWPQKPCDDVRQAEANFVKQHAIYFASVEKTRAAAVLATDRQELLLLLRDHCGENVQAKIDSDLAALKTDLARAESKPPRKPSRPSMNCITLGMGTATP